MGTSEDFPKCRAICDLLKLWYSNKKSIGDEIISLGIESDGNIKIVRIAKNKIEKLEIIFGF